MNKDDLMFGEMPEDDLPPFADDEIDANNDETFGGDIIPGDDELDDYAAQTACLRLDDKWGETNWKDSPAATDLPNPFGMPAFEPAASTSSLFNPGFGKLNDDLWGSQSSTSLYGLWGNGNTKEQETVAEDVTNGASFVRVPKQIQIRQKSVAPVVPSIPSMPKGPTLEELEREHASHVTLPRLEAQAAMIPALPPAALSLEEIENSILRERNQHTPNEIDYRVVAQGASISPVGMDLKGMLAEQAHAPSPAIMKPMFTVPPVPVAPSPVSQMGSGLPPLPPMHPMFAPFIPIWMDLLIGRIQYAPPGVPPLPPFLVMVFKQIKDPRVMYTLLQNSIQMPPMQRPNMGGLEPQASSNTPDIVSSRRGNTYHRKQPGMPSDKTIEDLAFDAFAGYMSCKERQWLVRIQLLQCAGTGNPAVDDYYYISWRQKQIDMGYKSPEKIVQPEPKEKENVNMNGRDRDRRRNRSPRRDNQQQQREPNDPFKKYSESLGLPYKSTTSNPRQLIRVDLTEGTEEDHEKKTSQKKLRTLLLRIESAITLLLNCTDIPPQTDPNVSFSREQQQKDISDTVALVYRDLFAEEFSKVLQISKGRQVFMKMFHLAAPAERATILNGLISASSGLTKKSLTECTTELIPKIMQSLLMLNREQMVLFTANLSAETIRRHLVEKNTLSRDLFLGVLMVCATKKAASKSPLFQWLKGPQADVNLTLSDWSSPVGSIWKQLRIESESVHHLSDWLLLLVTDPHLPSLAVHIAHSIR